MSVIKSRSISWIIIVSLMIMVIPMWVLAEETGPTQNIEQLKQIREVQNKSVLLKNLRENSISTQATPEQERMLRLSKALDKVTQQHQPSIRKSYSPNLNPQSIQMPEPQQTTQSGLREVMYGNGHMSDHPDSLFFNFLSGMNGSDTLGMDVKLSGNEGTNFGSDSWLSPEVFANPSMLYFLAEDGSLEDLPPVPTSDDPETDWTTISWEWLGGNGGQPLAVGNLWVVHTRTSNMYVVLEVTEVSGGWQSPSFSFDYVIQTDGSNDFGGGGGSIIAGSSFMNNAVDNERYFNYLQGLHGSDSTGMDVRASGNEGTNFGAEFSFGTDYSPIYLYAADSSLASVTEVGLVDDPDISWVETSWEANGYQPMQVGNVWVIYTRTSNMYAVMEITSIDEWGGYFEFDYMIQTDGSNIFDVDPPQSDFTMTVNGMASDELEIGSNPYFEITLDGNVYGELGVFWDGNQNGMLDDADTGLEFYEFMDNDIHDEDMTDGIFGVTFSDGMADGLNYLVGDLLFVAFADEDMATTPVTFYSVATPFSVSGSIYMNDGGGAPLDGIVVWAVYMEEDNDEDGPSIIGVTDGAGQYHLDLPDTGYVMVGTEDHFGATEGLVPVPNAHPVHVMSHEIVPHFYYMAPSSAIEGHVLDQNGLPVEDVQVTAHADDGPGYSAFTDEDGYYSIGVMNGGYDVEVAWHSLTEPYLIPYGSYVEVGDFAVSIVDFTLYTANNTITGNVTLDGMPMPGAHVFGQHYMLDAYSITMSGPDGFYSLPVHGDLEDLYYLGVYFEDMMNIVQTSENMDVPGGTTGEMITLETISGGLYGYFINGETNEPIMDTHEVGMMLRDANNGMEYYSGPDYDGYYEIHVPSGYYEVMAGGPEWMFPDSLFIGIGDTLINMDIVLYPLNFDASLEGFVYDADGLPIPYAQVYINNDGWGMGTQTDEFGYYFFELPVGFYYLMAFAEGYQDSYGDIEIQEGQNYYSFYLEDFDVDGAVWGQVYDMGSEDPVAGANVYLYGNDMGYMSMTDEGGEFWFDVPNGIYSLVVESWDYPPYWMDEILVYNDTTYLDIGLSMPDGGLEGFVRDDMGNPIWDAEVVIFTVTDEDTIGFWGFSNDSGYYSIPAMNGEYHVFASAPDFELANLGMVTIDNNWAYLDITLMSRQYGTPPMINFIFDQPHDQGRFVRMQFFPGGTDWGSFSGYSIWRITNTQMGPIIDFVEYLPNHELEAYNVVLPTLIDSSAHTPNLEDYVSAFFVTGHWDTYGFLDGEPGFGYSVDNIHPGMPGPLNLLSSGETGVELGWEISMDEDFQYFEVFRADNPDFVDASMTATIEPMFVDAEVTVGRTYFYQVIAVDANGNASEGSNVVTTSIVSVEDADQLPTAYGLSQNYPNPFNPTTSIEFALPEAAQVSLEVYNLLGQKVRTLVNGYVPAGYINTSWDGLDQNGKDLSSGTYIYRLKTAGMSMSKKMVLMK